jgi:hypothetical protein
MLPPIPMSAPLLDGQGRLTPMWQNWFGQVFSIVKPIGGNGTTANRPILGLYVGMDYFDSTLGYKVTVKSLNPTVWVNGAGGVV